MFEVDHTVLTLDSLRWDSFVAAKTPFLDSLGDFRQVYANCSFTFPAHVAMLKGYFPANEELREQYYSRRCGQVYKTKPLERFSAQSKVSNSKDTGDLCIMRTNLTVPKYLSTEHGYKTVLSCGASDWLGDPMIRSQFDAFHSHWFDVDAQIDEWLKSREDWDGLLYTMMNTVATHYPFTADGVAVKHPWRRSGKFPETKAFRLEMAEYKDAQIAALERHDRQLARLEKHLRRSLLVIVGDHGDDFGENGYFGHTHNSMNPGLFSVPMLVRLPD
jgi:hypothetical protein